MQVVKLPAINGISQIWQLIFFLWISFGTIFKITHEWDESKQTIAHSFDRVGDYYSMEESM